MGCATLDISGFDPLKVGVFDTAAQMAAALIFDTLTGRDSEGAVVPKFALSWTHSDDYKTWTFRLRSDVTFHDGTPFNAEAVSWKYARHKDPSVAARSVSNTLRVSKLRMT